MNVYQYYINKFVEIKLFVSVLPGANVSCIVICSSQWSPPSFLDDLLMMTDKDDDVNR